MTCYMSLLCNIVTFRVATPHCPVSHTAIRSKLSLMVMSVDFMCDHYRPTVTWIREDKEDIKMITSNGFAKGVKEWEGSELQLTNVKRGQMGAFMCIARNNVPPAVSRRIVLNVQCEFFILGLQVEILKETNLNVSFQSSPRPGSTTSWSAPRSAMTSL